MTKTLSDIIELPELLLKKESGYMTDIIFLIYKIFLIEYLQNNFSKIYGIYLIIPIKSTVKNGINNWPSANSRPSP